MKEQENILFRDKEALRAWLDKNSERKDSIWAVYYKKAAGKGTLTISEIVDVVVCYGWIDSQVKKVNDEKTNEDKKSIADLGFDLRVHRVLAALIRAADTQQWVIVPS